jgi:hypothetical protein
MRPLRELRFTAALFYDALPARVEFLQPNLWQANPNQVAEYPPNLD